MYPDRIMQCEFIEIPELATVTVGNVIPTPESDIINQIMKILKILR